MGGAEGVAQRCVPDLGLTGMARPPRDGHRDVGNGASITQPCVPPTLSIPAPCVGLARGGHR